MNDNSSPENNPTMPHSALIPHQSTDVQPHVAVTRAFSDLPEENGFSPAVLIRTLRQWWMFVIPAGMVLAVGAACLVVWLFPANYQARATIKISHSLPFFVFESNTDQRLAERFVQTQIELLRHEQLVLTPALGDVAKLEDFVNEPDPLATMQKNLSVDQIGDSELYRVQYTSHSPENARDIVNAIVSAYFRQEEVREAEVRQQMVSQLNIQKQQLRERLEGLRRYVVQLASEVTGKDPFGQGTVTNLSRALSLGPSSTLHDRLTEVEVKYQVTKAERDALQNASTEQNLSTDAEPVLLRLEIDNHPSVRRMSEEIAQLEASQKSVAKYALERESDPDYIEVEEQLKVNRGELEEIKGTIRQALLDQSEGQRAQYRESRLAELNGELNKLATTKALLTEKVEMEAAALASGGGKSAELELARTDLLREEEVFDRIAERQLELETEKNAPTRVNLIASALAPTRPVEIFPFKQLTVACLVALLAPFALAVLREQLVRRIADPLQLSRKTRLPVLGEIVRLPTRKVSRARIGATGSAHRQAMMHTESVDQLRASLLLSPEYKDWRVLAVASAIAGEGKTSTATSLAFSLERGSRSRVLVIDADLRSPDVSTILGTVGGPGLAELFGKKATPAEAIHRVADTQLYVLPAGSSRLSPAELQHGTTYVDLLAELRKSFRYIVVDTPPVLGANESLFLAKHSDAVLFCSLHELSRARHVEVAVKRLQGVGARLVGAVLGGVPTRSYAYSYGYYESKDPADAHNHQLKSAD